jgi:hypothetical protein
MRVVECLGNLVASVRDTEAPEEDEEEEGNGGLRE